MALLYFGLTRAASAVCRFQAAQSAHWLRAHPSSTSVWMGPTCTTLWTITSAASQKWGGEPTSLFDASNVVTALYAFVSPPLTKARKVRPTFAGTSNLGLDWTYLFWGERGGAVRSSDTLGVNRYTWQVP